MAGLIEVLEAGAATTVQDAGRSGFRRLGIPASGALDGLWLACANALVGNAPGAAGLECRLLGPTLRVQRGPLRLALAARVAARIVRAEGHREDLAPWRSATLAPGDTLRLGATGGAVAYLAVAGGIDLPAQLGSRATYPPAGLGGVGGRALRAGDALPCAPAAGDLERAAAPPRLHDGGPLRIVAGPQEAHFSAAARAGLAGDEYRVGRDCDRMGMRLDGPRLDHDPARGADIVSDGVAPGAIQVPGDGRPIVLLADCQTVGGYAKIATVIRADLPRLAHLLPGEALRFRYVGLAEARAALMAQTQRAAAWAAAIRSIAGGGAADESLLASANLVSGMVDALAEADAPDPEPPLEAP